MTEPTEITPLRIGFDAIRLFTLNSGLANYAKNMLLALKDTYPQHKYYLYTPRIAPNNENVVFIDDPSFEVRVYKGSVGLLWRAKSICKDIIRDELDVFHGLSIELPFGIEKTPARSVATIHDVLWREFPRDYRFYYRNILEYKLSHSLRVADHIISVSQATEDELGQDKLYDNKKSSVIYQVTSPEFYTIPDGDSLREVKKKYHLPDSYILAVGSFMGRKNISHLIESFKIVDRGTTQLIIIGEGHAESNQVRFIQNVLAHEMPSLYRLSKATVYPSLGEGYGLPIVESIMMEVPVLVFDKAPMNQFDSDLIYKFNNGQNTLAVALNKLLASKPGSNQGKYRAKSYRSYAEEIMGVYSDLLTDV